MPEKNLSESVYAALSERILRWDYMPGRRITEEELCAEFAMSRSPVREALHMLVENGLIERRPRQGYSVRLLDFKEINELYEFRLAIEEFVIARICSQGMDDDRIEELLALWSDLHARLPETAGLVPAADEEFHESLSGLTRNGAIVDALRDIDRRIHFVRLSDITSPERALCTCTEHMEILRAIRKRDLAAALAALRRNIEGGRSSVERAIKEALAHAYSSHE
ncbi:MAG TPA: GntR family transcriptional regulator [Rectinemataceae bacterium]|nr:GntR family transcriptional regulator [Rectinemataceae bacterium]